MDAWDVTYRHPLTYQVMHIPVEAKDAYDAKRIVETILPGAIVYAADKM